MDDDDKKKFVPGDEDKADVTDHEVKVKVGGAADESATKESETKKNDEAVPKKSFDRSELRRLDEDLDKELDRVESIDTEALARRSREMANAKKPEAAPEPEAESEVTPEETKATTAAVDLNREAAEKDPSSDPKKVGTAVVDSALQSHHLVQKQHQRRHISYVLVIVFVLLTFVGGGLAAYFYMKFNDVQSQLSETTLELDDTRMQREKLLAQVSEQDAERDKEAEAPAMRMIDELNVQYPVSTETAGIVYGYGGTQDEVVYMRFTTTDLADYREKAGDKETAPCGIGEAAPISIVRGTKEQLDALKSEAATVSDQKQIGEFHYALMTPKEACSAQKTEEVTEAQTAIKALYEAFTPVEEAAAPDDTASDEAAS